MTKNNQLILFQEIIMGYYEIHEERKNFMSRTTANAVNGLLTGSNSPPW
jgi:hypothetical protein